MRSRIIVAVVALTAVVGVGTLAARGNSELTAKKQWAITHLMNPVLIKNTIVMGAVLIVHDSEKMARGEACTTFYRFKPGGGPQEELVSFHCQPRRASAVETTTLTKVSTEPGCARLIEYQIAGDTEAHGVPIK